MFNFVIVQVESDHEHMIRSRRQARVMPRFNLFKALRPFIANDDILGCNAVCERYFMNEKLRFLGAPVGFFDLIAFFDNLITSCKGRICSQFTSEFNLTHS